MVTWLLVISLDGLSSRHSHTHLHSCTITHTSYIHTEYTVWVGYYFLIFQHGRLPPQYLNWFRVAFSPQIGRDNCEWAVFLWNLNCVKMSWSNIWESKYVSTFHCMRISVYREGCSIQIRITTASINTEVKIVSLYSISVSATFQKTVPWSVTSVLYLYNTLMLLIH